MFKQYEILRNNIWRFVQTQTFAHMFDPDHFSSSVLEAKYFDNTAQYDVLRVVAIWDGEPLSYDLSKAAFLAWADANA